MRLVGHLGSLDMDSLEALSFFVPQLFNKLFVKYSSLNKRHTYEDFLGGPVVKNPLANVGDTGSIPGPGRFHMPQGSYPCAPQLLKSVCPRAHALQQEKSPQ